TQPVYRRNGYERAGVAMAYKLPAHQLPTGRHGLEVRRATEADQPLLRKLYAARAQQTAGNLDRNEYMWERVFDRDDSVVSAYLVAREGTPEGYVAYTQQREGDNRDLYARDLVALTSEAARALLLFLAGHRSTIDHIGWMGSPADPLLFQVSDPSFKVPWYGNWLVRVVDVPAALQARGYLEGVEAELHLRVVDDVLPWNNGSFVLVVSEGPAEVREGGRGDLTLDVRGLAPLYSGYLSAHGLVTAGYAEGDASALALASTVFAGPVPWMAEGF
ncbi:MAG: sterol carrier protein domain-containing protein, partial [Chloroflexota bacterium]|nr:sterol carrier protein domain-containing protein [Chloroflexota bacterium]